MQSKRQITGPRCIVTRNDDRPTAHRVARRAHVLALVMYRASLEPFPRKAEYEALHAKLPQWIDKLGLASELAQEEHELLRAPLGKAVEQVVANASWRNEGLAVLAWALKRFELPRYDEQADPISVAASVGFTEELLAAMEPRSNVRSRPTGCEGITRSTPTSIRRPF